MLSSEQHNNKTEDVYNALKNRVVEAALVDAFIAASRSDLFSDRDIISRKMLQYSFTYGVVLSGDMVNSHGNVAAYVSNNRLHITQLVEKSTPKFSVSKLKLIVLSRLANLAFYFFETSIN